MLVGFSLNVIYSWGNIVWSRPFQVQGSRFGSCPLCVCVCVCKTPAFLAVATFALCTQETSDLFGSWQNSFLSIQVLLPS